MSSPMSPVARERALKLLREYLGTLQRRFDRAAFEFLDAHLRDAAHQQLMPVEFELLANGRISIDGVVIVSRGIGAEIAWCVLRGAELSQGEIRCDTFFPGRRRPDACAWQALQIAARAIEIHSRVVASAIRAIGTENGALVLRHPVRGVHCIGSRPNHQASAA